MRQKEEKMKKILATMMLMLPLVTEAMVDHNLEKMTIRADVVEIKLDDRYANVREMIFESGSILRTIEGCPSSFSKLRTIAIPSSVEIIGDSCFAACCYGDCLCEVTFEPGSKLREIKMGAFERTAIKRIEIPSSVEIIGDGCFHGCAGLREVTFGYGSQLQRIGKLAFIYTSLESITIPSSVKVIGANCFFLGGNSSLRCLSFESGSQLREIGTKAFGSDISVQGASHLSPAMSDRITQILDGER
jgi:hypothetical protein